MEDTFVDKAKWHDKRFSFEAACHNAGIEDHKDFIGRAYLKGLSGGAIAEMFHEDFNIIVSVRHIQKIIRELGIMRPKAEARALAIESGRMVYRKKPEHEKYRGKGISAGIRLGLLTDAGFKCSLCGNGRHNGYSIEIHHKDFNEKNNEPNNYEVLCYLCHRGTHENKANITELAENNIDKE